MTNTESLCLGFVEQSRKSLSLSLKALHGVFGGSSHPPEKYIINYDVLSSSLFHNFSLFDWLFASSLTYFAFQSIGYLKRGNIG